MKETTATLWAKVEAAKLSGKDYVETTKDVIETIVPGGVGDVGYFMYHGVRVFERGMLEKINEQNKVQVNEAVLGAERFM